MSKVFKTIYLRNIMKHAKIAAFVLIGGIISVSLLTATVLVIGNINADVEKNGYIMNHGDLYIQTGGYAEDEAIRDKRDADFAEYLSETDGISYTIEHQFFVKMTDEERHYYVELDEENIMSEFYYERIIDFDQIERYADLPSKPDKHSVIITDGFARRLSVNGDGVKVGDVLKIKSYLDEEPLELPVSYIIPNMEINLFESNWGSAYIDKSNYDSIPQVGDMCFYIDGTPDKLQAVQDMANEIYSFENHNYFEYKAENGGPAFPFKFSYTSDLTKSKLQFFAFPLSLLSVLAIICYILFVLSMLNLIHIMVIAEQKDGAVLKCLGLSNRREIFLKVSEIMTLMLPAFVIGITLGCFMFGNIMKNTTSFGVMSLTAIEYSLLILKVLGLNILIVLLLCVPVLFCICRRNVTDVLRGNDMSNTLKFQLFVVAIVAILAIFGLFSLLLNSPNVNTVLKILLESIAGMFLFCIVFSRVWHLFRTRSILRVSKKFLLKNKTRVPLTIMTYSLSFVMIYMMFLVKIAFLGGGKESGVWDNIYLFNMTTTYFMFCTIIVAVTCSIITYSERSHEFCLYSFFGGTKNNLAKMVFFENTAITVTACFLGYVLSLYAPVLTGMFFYKEIYGNDSLMLAVIIAFLLISVCVSLLSLKIIPFKSLNSFIRECDD